MSVMFKFQAKSFLNANGGNATSYLLEPNQIFQANTGDAQCINFKETRGLKSLSQFKKRVSKIFEQVEEKDRLISS